MTPKFPRLVAFAAALFLFAAASAEAASKATKAAKKPAAKAAAKPAGKGARGRETAAASRKSKNERAADTRRGKNSKNDRSLAKNDRRGSKADRAEQRKGKRGRDDDRAAARDSRKVSKRERMAEARREAERRRREAAERARQIAIARALAAARRRAADQALRDETVANILKDETTGEDMAVRRAAIDALGDRAGSVVVMNPKTGQVYTVVNQDWALRRGFKPCSTVKLVTGLAGLTERVIDPVQTVNIGTSSFSLDLTESLALSNNGYFQRVGGQVGFSKMMEYARKLGLGEPTGINHPFESPGRLPVFKEGYAVNHMSSHGDDIEVTTVQLARMASAIANGGKLLIPHLPRTPQENVNFKREVKREIDIPEENIRRILPGMIGAVTYGTGRRAAAPTMTVAGKTGTCTGQGSKLGLFTSFGPVHDPRLAVAVILRNSGTGGKWAAAVAGEVYRRLAQDARFMPRGNQPNLANEMLMPRPHIDPRKAAAVSDEEREGDEAEATEATNDVFVVSEAGGAQSTQQPALQKTSKTVERPSTYAPAPAPANTNTSAPGVGGAARPRRVSDRP